MSNTHRNFVTKNEISNCLGAPRVLERVEVIALEAENNEISVTAGQWFSLLVKCYDSFGVPLDDSNGDYLSIGIDEKNEQGAVMWGGILNSTQQGFVTFNRLVITQPGPVNIFISHSTPHTNRRRKINSFMLTVKPDSSKKIG